MFCGDPAVVVVARVHGELLARRLNVTSMFFHWMSDEAGICEVVMCPCGPAAASLQDAS